MVAKRKKRIHVEQQPASVTAWAKRHPERAKEERGLRKARVTMLTDWSHKNDGTPETHEHASKTRQGALARLYESGAITADQLAWANEIAMTAEAIERDVAVKTASLETRIDIEGRPTVALVEGVMRVRREQAYGEWRKMLPTPKRLVMDMILGEPIGYVVAARRYGIHNRKAKRYLIQAIDRWPECLEEACRMIDKEDVAKAHARLMG